MSIALGVHTAGRGEGGEASCGPVDVGREVGVQGQGGGGQRVVGVEPADGETTVGLDIGGRGGGAREG